MSGKGKNDKKRTAYSVTIPRGRPGPALKPIIDRLQTRIFGQDRAIRHAVRILARFMTELNDPTRPVGVLLFAGSSGVGKTYLAKELGYAWIGDPDPELGNPVVFISCEDLQEQHEVMALKGAPPSYVGYGDQSPFQEVGGYDLKKRAGRHFKQVNQYLDEINRQSNGMLQMLQAMGILPRIISAIEQKITAPLIPFRGIVIFDEIEKAHQNVRTILLGILEEGTFRLNSGITVDFTGTLFILTTNIASAEISEMIDIDSNRIGFRLPVKERIAEANGHNDGIWKRVKDILRRDKKTFPPELLGRIGDEGVVVFNLLEHKDYLRILDVELRRVQRLVDGSFRSPAAITIAYTDAFKEWLLEKGINPKFGARALRSSVEKHVRSELAFRAENGLIRSGDELLFDITYVQEENGEKKSMVEIRRKPRPRTRKLPLWRSRESKEIGIDVRRELRNQFADHGFPVPDGSPPQPKPPNQPTGTQGNTPDQGDQGKPNGKNN